MSRRGRMVAAVLAASVVLVALQAAAPASGQVATSCTGSQLVTTFTPCLNFVTGSTNGGGGGSPTQQCCKSVAAAVRSGADCACLILTGNVPFSLPINRTLAVSLPRLCNSMSVPLQCRDTAAPIPAPGPVPFSAALPPLPPMPPESPANDPDAASPAVQPPPPIIQGQRPVVVPSPAWRSAPLPLAAASVALLVAVASILV